MPTSSVLNIKNNVPPPLVNKSEHNSSPIKPPKSDPPYKSNDPVAPVVLVIVDIVVVAVVLELADCC